MNITTTLFQMKMGIVSNPLVLASLKTVGTNIQNEVVGLVLGLIVAFFAWQVLKSLGANNLTKVVATVVIGILAYFVVKNFDLVAKFFDDVFKNILG